MARLVSRKFRSTALANIILQYGLFDEWKVYSYRHPKVKSKYRLANLFLMNKKMLYADLDFSKFDKDLNMSNLEDFWYA